MREARAERTGESTCKQTHQHTLPREPDALNEVVRLLEVRCHVLLHTVVHGDLEVRVDGGEVMGQLPGRIQQVGHAQHVQRLPL